MAASRKSLEPKLFRLKEGKEADVLIGSKCQKCQRVFFPPREWCAACLEPTTKEVELSREGKLLSFSLIERQQSYSLVQAPYVLGEVELPEGPHIYTTINIRSVNTPEGIKLQSGITHENLNTLKIGQKVTLKPVVVKKDEEGNYIVAFNFDAVEK